MEISNLLSVTLRKNPDFDPKSIDLVQVEQKLQSLLAAKGVADTVMIDGKEVSLFGSDGLMARGVYQIIDPSDLKEDAIEIITTCWDISDDELINILLESVESAPDQVKVVKLGARSRSTQLKHNSFKAAVTGRSTSGSGTPGTPGTPPDTPEIPNLPGSVVIPSNPGGGEVPDTPGPSAPDDTIPEIKLFRKNVGGANSVSQRVDTSGVTVKLMNPITGGVYSYTIKAKSGTENVTLKFLDNNRLVIIGDNLDIEAIAGQNDDIILIGRGNTINTNSGNDKIRVGQVIDSVLSEERQSDNNEILTGTGDDYVIAYGVNITVNDSGGNDTFRIYGETVDNYIENYSDINGIENIYSIYEAIAPSDGKMGGSTQGQFGDCKYISFLNSFRRYLEKTGISLSEFVTISPSAGGNYEVTFVKSSRTVIISPSDFTNSKNADGDVDNVILEIALRKLLEADGFNMNNSNNDQSLGQGKNSYLISKYFFGNGEGGNGESILISKIIEFETPGTPSIDNTTNFDNQFRELLTAYNNNQISNLTVGTGDNSVINKSLGILNNHAYAVVGGVPGSYVELVNPWDGNDLIKLDWEDFIKYFNSIMLYGSASDWAKNKNYENSILNKNGDLKLYPYTGTPRFNAPMPGGGDPQVIADELSHIQQCFDVVKDILNIERKFELYT